MFQLFDLIMTSAVGMFLVNAFETAFYAALVAGDCDECGFNDLGKLLFGGVLLAILVGITVSLLYRRKRDNDSASAQFVSIRSTKPED
jgi:amino acid transporter